MFKKYKSTPCGRKKILPSQMDGTKFLFLPMMKAKSLSTQHQSWFISIRNTTTVLYQSTAVMSVTILCSLMSMRRGRGPQFQFSMDQSERHLAQLAEFQNLRSLVSFPEDSTLGQVFRSCGGLLLVSVSRKTAVLQRNSGTIC